MWAPVFQKHMSLAYFFSDLTLSKGIYKPMPIYVVSRSTNNTNSFSYNTVGWAAWRGALQVYTFFCYKQHVVHAFFFLLTFANKAIQVDSHVIRLNAKIYSCAVVNNSKVINIEGFRFI